MTKQAINQALLTYEYLSKSSGQRVTRGTLLGKSTTVWQSFGDSWDVSMISDDVSYKNTWPVLIPLLILIDTYIVISGDYSIELNAYQLLESDGSILVTVDRIGDLSEPGQIRKFKVLFPDFVWRVYQNF